MLLQNTVIYGNIKVYWTWTRAITFKLYLAPISVKTPVFACLSRAR